MDPTAVAAAQSGEAVSSAGAMVVELAGILARLADAAVADSVEGDRQVDAARVDAVGLLERIQAAAAAAQAVGSVAFARSHVTLQQQQVLRDPRAVGRGIADQLALACRVSPSEGSRRLGIARALHLELPATAGLLRQGWINFYVAALVVSESRHLDPDRRRQVDAQIVAGELAECAPRQAAALARRCAHAADPEWQVRSSRTGSAPTRTPWPPPPRPDTPTPAAQGPLSEERAQPTLVPADRRAPAGVGLLAWSRVASWKLDEASGWESRPGRRRSAG